MNSKAYRAWLVGLALLVCAPLSLFAQDRDDWGRHDDNSHRSQYIHANISGGTGNGKCTFEVVVYGVAEVQIRGDEGRLVSIDGAPAEWRRLDCNQPVPTSTRDFDFKGVDGHGKQGLVQSPNNTDGVAVVRIDNTVGGKAGKGEGYTGDITWKGGRYSDNTFHGDHGWNGAPNSGNNWAGAPAGSVASQACMNAVAARIQQEHQNVTNLRPLPDTTTESQQSDGRTAVQGEGQYQAENGNYGKFSYRCLYDQTSQSVLESSYSRE
jgi:hypothetical protein